VNREQWNDRYRAVPLLWQIDPGPFLGQEVGTMAPGHALDLGAGEGRNSIWLAQHGWRVTAVDFSDVALDRGRQLAEQVGVGPSIRWVNQDVLDFYPDQSDPFDLVVCLFLHLRADERRQVLRRAVAALAPGGTVLVVGYDTTNAEGGNGVRDPAILFSPADIAEDLEGLRIEQGYQLRIGDSVDAIVRASKPRSVER
jgi:2-polyprenyl-3-methyl-5-hydroxy-6-metoxy-1,4-benzoquinol methylase